MVRLINSSGYPIVEKESTRVLKKTIDECRMIHNCWMVLSPVYQHKLNDDFNREIDYKLKECFKYYQKNYGVEIEKGHGDANDIFFNIMNICETIKSWEGD